jgi:protein dithiol:quinone oxidoreductase
MIAKLLTSRKLALAGFLVCTGLILAALYFQYVEHLEPCPLCMLQRICFFVLGIVFLIAALHGPRKIGVRVYGVLELALACTGLGFATRHVWLQWYPPATESCTSDLFYQMRRFPVLNVIEKALRATGDCAKVDWTFLGLSMAQWSWIWFAILALLVVRILLRSGRSA